MPWLKFNFCPTLKARQSPGDISTIIEAILSIQKCTRESSVLEDSLAALSASSNEESLTNHQAKVVSIFN